MLRMDRSPYSRFWAIWDDQDLVAVVVYKKGVRHEAHDWNGWKIPRALPESP